MVYVSCGPDTLARDLAVFKRKGYEAKEAWGRGYVSVYGALRGLCEAGEEIKSQPSVVKRLTKVMIHVKYVDMGINIDKVPLILN